jgi:hypothetical protein
MRVFEMNEVRIGDIVKSHDFVGIDNTYLIGKVVGVHFDGTFRAKLIKEVFDGVEKKKPRTDFFDAPLPGRMVFDRPDFERIVILESSE